MRYAILNSTLDQVEEVRFYTELPPHKEGRVLPIIEDETPTYDPDTHKVVAGDYLIGETEVTQTWQVVELDEGELEEVKNTKAAQTQTDTNTIYNTLSVAHRATFAPLYVAVKDFLSRRDYEAAYTIIERQEVPPELETIKDQLLERIGENIPQ